MAVSAFLGLSQPFRWQVCPWHILLAAGLVGQSPAKGMQGGACARKSCCGIVPSPWSWAVLLWQDLPVMTNSVTEWKHKKTHKINALCRGSHLSDVGLWAVKQIKTINEWWNLSHSVRILCIFACRKILIVTSLVTLPLIMKFLCIFSKSHMSFVGSLKLAVACRHLPDTAELLHCPLPAPPSAGEKSYLSLARVIWVNCPKTVNSSWTSICIWVINQRSYLAVPNSCKVTAIL